jgi:hypothetical protein
MIKMGACISEDLTVEQPPEPQSLNIAGQHKSLVEFVRALSEPSVMDISSTESKMPRRAMSLSSKSYDNMIKTIEELTPQQEAFISSFKMQIYGQKSDYLRQISTFEYIENEFYNKYNKSLSRRVLYSLFGI